ncbi:MAG: HDOD domain-containing protein [Desulfovibrionaceae bacterium]
MSRREVILAKVRDIPQMPAAVQQVLGLLRDEEADMGKVSRIIELDPGLTANLLRAVNSSYFGGMRTIATVREAIIRLGANRVFHLAISWGVAPHVKPAIRGYGLDSGELLEHSLAVALAAEGLAGELSMPAPPNVFTAGLLVNIGKVILGSFLEIDADPILKLAFEEGVPFEEAEERVLGVNHAEAGAALLEHWNLPEDIVDVVRYCPHPEKSPRGGTALDLVHLGDGLAKMSGIGLGSDGLAYPICDACAERLRLSEEHVHKVLQSLPGNVEELMRIFMG